MSIFNRIVGRSKTKMCKNKQCEKCPVAEADKALGIGTYRKEIGKRKDGSIIWSKQSFPLEEAK